MAGAEIESDGSRSGLAPEVVVVASFLVHAGREEEAIAAFAPTIEQTHEESGCLSYALHRDASTPNRLVLVERWSSQADLDSHLTQPYVARLGEVAGDLLVEPPVVNFCSPVPIGDPGKGVL